MQCCGRTKTSNFRKRCTKNAKFLFCWQHIWQPFICIVFILSALATISEVTDYSLKDIIGWFKHDLKPDISCVMEYPIKTEPGKIYRNTKNPDIIIKNNGPIKAVAITVDLKVYVYNQLDDSIIIFFDMGFRSFDHFLSAQELKPFKELKKSVIGHGGKEIKIYYVEVKYHHESNMKRNISMKMRHTIQEIKL